MSLTRRTGRRQTDSLPSFWRVATLILLLAPTGAHAQALRTVRLAGGEARLEGRTLRVTGGYVDPRTGEGRVEVRGRVLRFHPRRVRTSGLVTRIDGTRRGRRVRLRLRLAQLLIERGTTTLAIDPGLGLTASGCTFRITGGRLDARTLSGLLAHVGTCTLTRGDRSVLVLDLGVRPGEAVTAQVGDVRPEIGTLGPAEVAIRGLAATLDAMPATLTDAAADGLNFALQTDAYHGGMPLGTVTVRGRLRG